MHGQRSLLMGLFFFIVTGGSFLQAQPCEVPDAASLKLAMKKLTVLGSVLYIAAHPDDENTAVLAYCTNGRLLRTAYLSITRGDGGQNLIGSEQAELLGIIRTQELLAARKIDGAEQYFTRALDFGYSKSPDETMEFWNRDSVLSDIVWVIRKFRPDVIITRFPSTGEGGHGHHTASAILAGEAFHIAGDPSKFPEQVPQVGVWQPKRLLHNAWLPLLQQRGMDPASVLKLDVGDYNPLLGKSYTEIAAASRSMHKSQGFGSTGQRGETLNYFVHTAGDSARNDFMDKIDLTWSRVTGGAEVGEILHQAYVTFNPERPEKSIPLLLKVFRNMSTLRDDPWVHIKRAELLNVIRGCAGMWIEAISGDYAATPGSPVKISAVIINRSDFPLQLKSLRWPFTPAEQPLQRTLRRGEIVKIDSAIRLPEDIPITQPYWLREEPGKGSFRGIDRMSTGLPENIPPLNVSFTLQADGTEMVFNVPVAYRWNDPVHGEEFRPFEIRPNISVQLEERIFIFPDSKEKVVRVILKSGEDGISGSVALKVPKGWTIRPESTPFTIGKKGGEMNIPFHVLPPASGETGMISAEASIGKERFNRGITSIHYGHILEQTLFPPAHARLLRLDAKRKRVNVGYVLGPGDPVPQLLMQLGYSVHLLDDAALDEGRFEAFDVIVMGVRAYNTRDRLRIQQSRLLDYVRRGGTLIVQYNVNRGLQVDSLGPYPFRISNDRVSVEDAPVMLLDPWHPLLTSPYTIRTEDFDGWLQERGLYFADQWDSSYQTVIASHDPGETLKPGGTLYAKYGKGVYIYSGYSWFRQLPAGVPGAYRLFINMMESDGSR